MRELADTIHYLPGRAQPQSQALRLEGQGRGYLAQNRTGAQNSGTTTHILYIVKVFMRLYTRVFVNGKLIAVQGAAVVAHGLQPDAAPVIVGHSETVFAHGIPICRAGDAATCGHPATGSDNVFAG